VGLITNNKPSTKGWTGDRRGYQPSLNKRGEEKGLDPDQRGTRPGVRIRKTCLDELPQKKLKGGVLMFQSTGKQERGRRDRRTIREDRKVDLLRGSCRRPGSGGRSLFSAKYGMAWLKENRQTRETSPTLWTARRSWGGRECPDLLQAKHNKRFRKSGGKKNG